MANKVAVITGASSGIGRMTALKLAEQGMDVVLLARNIDTLKPVADECSNYGVDALAISVDMGKEAEVIKATEKIISHFSSFDIWINNAAVTLLGSFTDLSSEDFDKVLHTNLNGYVYGTRAALRHFNTTGNGHIILISSVFGAVTSPYESPYVTSKFAIRGLAGSLRQELYLEGKEHIHISTVLPSAINTPIYKHAKNQTEKAVQPPPPIYSADKVADTILNLVHEPKPEVIVGRSGKMLVLLEKIVPKTFLERCFAYYIHRLHFTDKPKSQSANNLNSASDMNTINGQWPIVKAQKAGKLIFYITAIAISGYVIKKKSK